MPLPELIGPQSTQATDGGAGSERGGPLSEHAASSRLRRELDVFLACPPSMRILLVSNMIYAFVLPVIEIFIAAYVMRNSNDLSKVIFYQLAVYVATPVAFFINGLLLGKIAAKRLYAAGMVLSGVSMMLLMRTGVLTSVGIAASGLGMGLSTGLFWANRGFLALSTTNDRNRNYFYGLEMFSGTLTAVMMPACIGWFIAGTVRYGWLGGFPNHAYRVIAMFVFALTVLSAAILQSGTFRNPSHTKFVFFRFHSLWYKMLQLTFLKGLAHGYILTVPAMLIMLLVGKEGTLGATQAVGGVLSAFMLYGIGRGTAPRHRVAVLALGVLLFLAGSLAESIFFNAVGALIFMGCLVLAKPLLDLAYNPIELRVVDAVARLEQRSEYAYLFNHEFALFTGRLVGCLTFLAIARWASGVAALKYALPAIAIFQGLSVPVATSIVAQLNTGESAMAPAS